MQKVLHSLPKQHPFVLGAILFIGAPIGLLLTVGGITTIFGGLVFCMSGLL